MRTIKFRGKRCDNSEWVCGDYVECTETWKGGHPHKCWIVTSARSNGGFFALNGRYPVQNQTIGQFTGLHDKNGKEIFEGDIVAFTFYSDLAEHARLEERPEITENYVILFHDGSFWMNRIVVPDSLTAQLYGRRVVLESLWKHRVEVIGNIHDNPELLKGGKE